MVQKNYIGQIFNSLTIIEKTQDKKYNRPVYHCKCECGKDVFTTIGMMSSGDVVSCGCKRKSDIQGMRSGRLVAIENIGKDDKNNCIWKCQCDCGNIINVKATSIKTQRTKSCGCVRDEKNALPKNLVDYTGREFGYLKVLKKTNKKKRQEYFYDCQCVCGKIIQVVASALLSGDRTSCGCQRKDNLIGRKFGRLEVIKFVEGSKNPPLWECRCECGKIKKVSSKNLLKEKTNSCGCLARELSSKRKVKNIKGLRSGKLVAIKLLKHRANRGRCIWLCKCDCGRYTHVRTSDITGNHIESCGNCGNFINGVRVSKPQFLLHKMIGRGVINYKSKRNLVPDIAFVYNGRKIAIEYDEEVWHDEIKDLEKTKRLLRDGWKIIRIFVNDKYPNQEMYDFIVDSLSADCDYSRLRIL